MVLWRMLENMFLFSFVWHEIVSDPAQKASDKGLNCTAIRRKQWRLCIVKMIKLNVKILCYQSINGDINKHVENRHGKGLFLLTLAFIRNTGTMIVMSLYITW